MGAGKQAKPAASAAPQTRKTSAAPNGPRVTKAPARSSVSSTTAKAAKAAKVTKSSAPREPTRDPAGGLTAAGRTAFARSEGAHLKPGVKKPVREMTLDELHRKGSWATRFYGRAELPRLVDDHGRPTRFALSAHAWGEPVPRTEAAARRIADKGRRLLERYRRLKAKA
jgi:hypothetical protein